jgi:peptidoglycan/xylan/chitin deacetylase (PgdA/CDA1 family)
MFRIGWLLGLWAGIAALAPAADLTERQGAIVRGPRADRRLALVFTGHEFAEGGETILDELASHRSKGTFFLTGDFLDNPRYRSLVRGIMAEGHGLGPHSDKHLLYCEWAASKKPLVSKEAFKADLLANLAKIEPLGAARPRYFLPPYEHYNEEIARWSAELGLRLVNYTPGTRSNADYTEDKAPNFVPSRAIFDSILRCEKDDAHGLNGFILLLHIGAGAGRTDKFHARFGALLDELAGKGYRFVRLEDLLEGEAAPLRADDVFIRASQVGYEPKDPKLAMALSRSPLPAEFAVVDAETGAPVFTARVMPMPGERWGAFEHHAELDFSPVERPGRYIVKFGDARSLPLVIGERALADLPDQLLEFMRQQRCGYNPWLGVKCHQLDGRTAYGPRPAGSVVDAVGGWHDAGDLLKYHMTSGNATAQMLLAFMLGGGQKGSGSRFADRVDAGGDPKPNGIPDLLDEARWGLEWMLKMHPGPDELYHQVADDRDHTGFRLPQNEIADYGWGKGGARVVYFADGKPQGLGRYKSESTGVANIAGRYAAAMGLAYQIWKDDPAERGFAGRCLKAGREVYQLGRAREGFQQGNSYSAPYRYEESTWADDMEWGAAELFRATGERRYLDEARHYAQLAADDTWMGRDRARHYQYYPFQNAGHFRLYDLVDPDFQKVLAGYYRAGIDRCVRAGEGNPYRVGVPFIWCSNNLVVALVTQCHFYERMTGDARYRGFAARNRDWLLGRNPWGYAMFTEVGRVFPKDVHVQTTKLTGRSVRGGLVDGPISESIFRAQRGVAITQPDPLAPFQDPRAVYHDDIKDYASNEPTMDGTASAILMWVAGVNGKAGR